LLRQRPAPSFILLEWSSISLSSLYNLTMWSMYRGLVARMEVLQNCMWHPKSTVHSTTADSSGCYSQMCRWCSFNLVSTQQPVCPM
jgi:hypothetical protein